MATPYASSRIEWIDVAKGIGITCVLLGHVSHAGFAARVVYLFHMPLFFILSGYLFRPQPDALSYARRKAIHLLIPYLAGVVLSGSVYLGHVLMHRPHPLPLAHWAFSLLWGGARFAGYFGVLWFLTCLYIAQQLLNAMMMRLTRRAVGIWMVAFAAGGLLLSHFLSAFSLPLDANVVLMAAPLLFCGVLLKRHPLPHALAALVGATSFAAGVVLLRNLPNAFMDMRVGHYGIPVLSFAIAVGCSIGVFALSRALVRVRLLSIPFTHLGELSLSIMLIHKVMPILHHMTHSNPLAVFLWDLLGAWAISSLLSRFSWGRLLFQGAETDFNRCILRRAEAARPTAGAKVEEIQPPQPERILAANGRQ